MLSPQNRLCRLSILSVPPVWNVHGWLSLEKHQDFRYATYMTITELRDRILELPADDLLELFEEILQKIESTPISQWQKKLLDRRLAAGTDEQGKAWEEIKTTIWSADG